MRAAMLVKLNLVEGRQWPEGIAGPIIVKERTIVKLALFRKISRSNLTLLEGKTSFITPISRKYVGYGALVPQNIVVLIFPVFQT